MKLRLSEPGIVVDISGIDDLKGISRDGDTIKIGALTTHSKVASSDVVKDGCAALAEAAGMIGDPQVRNRGTIGGNVAHADPASDYPGILVALGATIVTNSQSVAAEDFFTGLFETALGEGEIRLGNMLEHLRKAGYDGAWTAEYEGSEAAGGIGYEKCYRWLAQHVG